MPQRIATTTHRGQLNNHRRNHIGDVEAAGNQEDLFDAPVGSFDHENPNENGAERHGEIAADPEQVEGTGDPGEVCRDVRQVHQQQGDHHEKSSAQTELLANQIR